MLKWVLSSLFFTVIVLLILVAKYGINPKPRGLIKPSQFNTTKEVGAVTFKRMFKYFDQGGQFIFVTDKNIPQAKGVWVGLTETAQAYKRSFPVTYTNTKNLDKTIEKVKKSWPNQLVMSIRQVPWLEINRKDKKKMDLRRINAKLEMHKKGRFLLYIFHPQKKPRKEL